MSFFSSLRSCPLKWHVVIFLFAYVCSVGEARSLHWWDAIHSRFYRQSTFFTVFLASHQTLWIYSSYCNVPVFIIESTKLYILVVSVSFLFSRWQRQLPSRNLRRTTGNEHQEKRTLPVRRFLFLFDQRNLPTFSLSTMSRDCRWIPAKPSVCVHVI